MAAITEIISLFVIGPSMAFAAGLLVGTAISIIGFMILVRSGRHLLESEKGAPVVLGYVNRMLLYAVSFFVCINFSVRCGAGCGFGFISVHLGIIFLYSVVYNFFKKKKNPLNDWTEPKQWNDLSIYDDEDDDWPKRDMKPETDAKTDQGIKNQASDNTNKDS
ncbi:MAG: hypothetical protein PHS19_03395 [Eubacteriales bacterium]|nr:hypothetical protein [Eubacteriales bacterium]